MSKRYLDQTLISVNIENYVNKYQKSKLDKIRYRGLRLDRGPKPKWIRRLTFKFDQLTDCHSFQANVFENWPLLQQLFLKLFNRKYKIIFDKYYSEYIQIRKTYRII